MASDRFQGTTYTRDRIIVGSLHASIGVFLITVAAANGDGVPAAGASCPCKAPAAALATALVAGGGVAPTTSAGCPGATLATVIVATSAAGSGGSALSAPVDPAGGVSPPASTTS